MFSCLSVCGGGRREAGQGRTRRPPYLEDADLAQSRFPDLRRGTAASPSKVEAVRRGGRAAESRRAPHTRPHLLVFVAFFEDLDRDELAALLVSAL